MWTSLIGHAFLELTSIFTRTSIWKSPISACEHILRDLRQLSRRRRRLHQLHSRHRIQVHNANTLGGKPAGSHLSRTPETSPTRAGAERRSQYTAQYQRADASWYYGEKQRICTGSTISTPPTCWIAFKHYIDSTGDHRFDQNHDERIRILEEYFFPAGWHSEILRPQDAADRHSVLFTGDRTLVFFHDRDPESLALALKVARWTIENMQDRHRIFLLSAVFAVAGQQNSDAALGTGDDALRACRTVQIASEMKRDNRVKRKNPHYC